MTRPLFVAGPHLLDGAAPGSSVVLDGGEGRHAASVRRIRAGEVVDVADGAGLVATCTVTASSRDRLDLVVDALTRAEARLPRLVLVQALAKGGRDELAVETATEFGVDAVVPWQAERCVVVWSGDRGERGRRRWESTALAAAKQSRRPDVPPVRPALATRDLTALAAGGACLLVLHEEAEQPLSRFRPPAGVEEILVAVGPEGGVSGREVADLVAAGAHVVRLGPEVLRSSSAGPAAVAVLSVLLERW